MTCLEVPVIEVMSTLEKEMKHPPQFLEKLQNMGIPDGTPVRLECRVVGMPPPVIFWKKDNDTIPKTKDRIRLEGVLCLSVYLCCMYYTLIISKPSIIGTEINSTLSLYFSMTQDATGYVCLLIQPTTKDDAGWYTVSAKNEAGIVSCTCRLDIYG